MTWQDELRRTDACIPIERLGDELTPREHSHLAHCARCQAELELWQQMNAEETAAESEPVSRIADALRAPRTNVVPFAPRRAIPRAAYAIAAMLVVVIGVAIFMQNREPSIDGSITPITSYRSAGVEVVAPSGDLAAAPAALRWKAAPGATAYDVEVMEVDRTTLWRASTAGTAIDLPPSLVAQFVKGKTILWQVQARRDQAIVAGSGIQRFRVK